MKKKDNHNKDLNVHDNNISTKSKKSGLPNFGVIDVVIILLVVVIVAGLYVRYSFYDKLNSTKNIKECYVTFKTDKITSAISRELSKDDRVYFKSDGTTFGVLAVKSEEISMVIQEQPATSTVFKDGNTYSEIQYPQGLENSLIYGTGTIKCDCAVTSDGSYLLNGSQYISPGQTYTVCTERATFNITIVSIEEISENQ